MIYLSSCARYGVPYLTPHLGELTSVLASPLFLSSDCILLREEVVSLISILGLVQIGSEEERCFQRAMAASRYSRYHFCDRYKDYLRTKKELSDILCRELYKRKRFRSYVYASYRSH